MILHVICLGFAATLSSFLGSIPISLNAKRLVSHPTTRLIIQQATRVTCDKLKDSKLL